MAARNLDGHPVPRVQLFTHRAVEAEHVLRHLPRCSPGDCPPCRGI
jgi:hypothetical protein